MNYLLTIKSPILSEQKNIKNRTIHTVIIHSNETKENHPTQHPG